MLTSVDRDDLPDGGSGHFAQTVRALKVYLIYYFGVSFFYLLSKCCAKDFWTSYAGAQTGDIGGMLNFGLSR